jgi:hypothetical protein
MHRVVKNLSKTIEESGIRVRALFSKFVHGFLASNSRPGRILFGYGRLNGGQDNSSRATSMRKFLELARMTLMEDIVAIDDSDRIHELSSAAKIASTPAQSHRTLATQERSFRIP